MLWVNSKNLVNIVCWEEMVKVKISWGEWESITLGYGWAKEGLGLRDTKTIITFYRSPVWATNK